MFRFIHLTDLHLVPSGAPCLYGLDPVSRLAAAIADINARHGPGSAAQAGFVLITGDLVHFGSSEAYRTLADALETLSLPWLATLGNHDDRAQFRAVFPKAPVDPNGYVQFVQQAGGTTLIVLDSHEAGVPYGALGSERLAWLGARLAEGTGPVILAMHHPPLPIGLKLMDRIGLQDAQALWQVIEPHRGRIRHLLFGHTHRALAGSWRGIPFSNGFGTNHQVGLDFALTTEVRGSHEPPTYAVVQVAEEDIIVHFHGFLDGSATFLL